MKNKKTKNLVLYALFIALEISLVFIPFLGYIPIGPLRATTLHIPVIIAGIVLGKKGGAMIGCVFGLSSLFYNTISPTVTSFVFSPFISGSMISAVIALVPRILIGFITGFLFEQISKKSNNTTFNMSIAATVGALTNTILVLGGIYFLFGGSYATALGKNFSDLAPYLLGIITTQGIIEAIVGAIVAVIVSSALLKVVRRT